MDFDFSRQNVDCNDGTVRQGDALPLSVTERVGSRLPLDAASVMLASDSSSVNASDLAERNSLSRTVNPASTGRCRINMVLAAEGERIAAGMVRQHIEDLIADAIYDAELGNLGHRRQAEAVLAALIQHGAIQ